VAVVGREGPRQAEAAGSFPRLVGAAQAAQQGPHLSPPGSSCLLAATRKELSVFLDSSPVRRLFRGETKERNALASSSDCSQFKMAAAEVDPVSDLLLLSPLPYLRSNRKSSGGNPKKKISRKAPASGGASDKCNCNSYEYSTTKNRYKKTLEFYCEFLADSRSDRDKPQARGDWWYLATGVLRRKNLREIGSGVGFFFLVEADLGCGLDQDQETGARTQRIATRFAVAPNGESYRGRGGEGKGPPPKGSVR
jgi:hypothetical protein